jgi:hypothetical protein
MAACMGGFESILTNSTKLDFPAAILTYDESYTVVSWVKFVIDS